MNCGSLADRARPVTTPPQARHASPVESTRHECGECGGHVFGTLTLVDGRYAIQRKLGAGAMGVVYLARDIGLARDVAIKLIAPRAMVLPGAAEHFRQEASALAAIRDENVVAVYAFGPHEGSVFFAMEFVAGPTVFDLILEHDAHGTSIPAQRALHILIQVARGLAAVHARGIIHRDVKPANIVIEEDTGRPVLVDFGLALQAEAVDASSGLIVGTPAYMAPEQAFRGGTDRVTPAVDIYSLGCTAFELLTNRPPFAGYDLLRQHAQLAPPKLSSLRPKLAALDAVLEKALAKDPARRYANCDAFADALTEAGAPWLGATEPASLPRILVDRAKSPVPDTVHILVVDDDNDFRRFATRAAQLAFYRASVRVASAASGPSALDEARRTTPHLVLLDYDMPGLDGIDTLSALRVLPDASSARVVVVSARAGTEERWRFGALGVRDFISKPVDLPALVQLLTSIALRSGLISDASDDSPGEEAG